MLSRYRIGVISRLSLANIKRKPKVLVNRIEEKSIIKKSDAEKITSVQETDIDPGVSKFLTVIPIKRNKNHRDVIIPKLKDVGVGFNKDSIDIFAEKLRNCCTLCDFTDNEADIQAKSNKTSELNDILLVVSNKDNVQLIPIGVIDILFSFFLSNLKREIPIVPAKYLCSEEEPSIIENNWPHLSIVYSILEKYQAASPKDEHFDRNFLDMMRKLLGAIDFNERKMVLVFFQQYFLSYPHNVLDLFQFFSATLSMYLSGAIYPFSVFPILVFFNTNVQRLPSLKELFFPVFFKHVVPLLFSKHILTFQESLTSIILFMISYDNRISTQILKDMFRKWPFASPAKQLIFLTLSGKILENISLQEFDVVAIPLAKVLSKCAKSDHNKIVEQSFIIWTNVKVVPLLLDKARVIMPIVLPSLMYTIKYHWNPEIQSSAMNAIKAIHNIDHFVFDDVTKKIQRNASKQNTKHIQTQKGWATIARTAATKDKEVNLARTLTDLQQRFGAGKTYDENGIEKPPDLSRKSSNTLPSLKSETL